MTESLLLMGISGQVGREVTYSSDPGHLLGLGDAWRGEDAPKLGDVGDTSDHHAATAVC